MPSAPSPAKGTRTAERRIRLATALFGAVLAVLIGQLGLTRIGGSLRMLSYDAPFLLNRGTASDRICVVFLDEFEGEAVDRSVHADLLDRLGELGARAVVYDLIFDRPSEDPEIDREFAAAMLRFRGVDADWNPVAGRPRRWIVLACGRKEIRQTGVVGEQLIPPTDELLAAADDFGLVALVHDKEYTVRELTAGTPDEPSMMWKAAALLGAPLREEDRQAPRWLRFLGQPLVGSAGSGIPSYPAKVVPSADAAMFRDKIVVIGAKPGIVGQAAGQDLFATPFHRFDLRGDLPLTSGVVLQATMLSNFLRQDWLTRTRPATETWLIVVAGVLLGFGFSRLRPTAGVLAAIAVICLLFAAGSSSVHLRGLWFPWSVVAFLQVPVALVWGGASNFYVERLFRARLTEEQRQLRDAFAKYVSPQMLDVLTAEGFRMRVGGEKVEAAMIFTDLENFTNMSESVGDPERIVALLNDYFERTTAHIFDHDGVVIKFIGDAIFAEWGAPLAEPEAALKAARAAWKLSEDAILEVDGVTVRTRIGLHFGEVVAGNIGSARRVDYTLIGDAVNLAARLESLNKMLGTGILISDEVWQRIGDEFHTRMVGRFKVKGRKEVTIIHELLGPADGQPEPEWVGRYHDAVDALAVGDHEAARRHLVAAEADRGKPDGPSRFFLQRLNAGDPLPGGIAVLTEK